MRATAKLPQSFRITRGIEKLRLLIVTFDPPQNIGGVEGRVRGYVHELTKNGTFVEIEALAPDYEFTRESFEGVTLHKYPSRVSALPRAFRHTERVMINDSIDSVFLLSGGITLLGNLLLFYCRLTGRRSAMLLYGKDILQARRSMLARSLALTSQILANRVATNSLYTASLLHRFVRGKVDVLPPSIDSSRAEDTDFAMSRISPGKILFVGRLISRKGVDELIEAFKMLLPDFPNARLEIVGDGPERPRLTALVKRLGLVDSVTFYGSLRGDALYQKYRECDFVAMPSRTMKDDVEGFGTVFLEAGLMGRPSVGTYSGGIPEAVTDKVTGLLVKEGNIDELAAALHALVSDEGLREELGRNARARVLRDFTWKVTATRLEEILRT
jgi:phosphatidylinositol alpha-1,6-mannosyltransferase